MIATLTRSRLVLWWLHLAPMFLAVVAAMMMHRVQSRQLLSGSFSVNAVEDRATICPAGESSIDSLR